MLVARAFSPDGHELLILGLSQENRRRLVMGNPISLNVLEVAGKLEILLFAGETEESMRDELVTILTDHAASKTEVQ